MSRHPRRSGDKGRRCRRSDDGIDIRTSNSEADLSGQWRRVHFKGAGPVAYGTR